MESSEYHIVRVGDFLDKVSRDNRTRKYYQADNLAQRIFDPAVSDDDTELTYFVRSDDWNKEREIAPELLPHFRELSHYEKYLMGKIFASKRHILFIEDCVGAGKTTTINYIRKRIISTNCCDCKMNGKCIQTKKVKRIAFDHNKFNVLDETKARATLLRTLIIEIKNGINETCRISDEEEYVDFWMQQLIEYEEKSTPSSSFLYIASKLEDKYPDLLRDKSLFDVSQNKEILRQIEKDSDQSIILDYLLRKWGFIIKKKYNNFPGCSFIWIDNIDKASIVTQSLLVNLLTDCAVDPGPRIIVTIRPETYARLGFLKSDNGSNVFDFIDHVTPAPSIVVFDRMKKFIDNPDSYYDANDGINKENFSNMKEFIISIFNVICKNGVEGEYFKLLDLFSGNSKRIALLCAQKLLFISNEEFMRMKSNENNIIRTALINQSKNQKETRNFYDPIANILDVKEAAEGRCLIKLRILTLLENSHGELTLGTIINTISHFYENGMELIRNAINEMINIYCQLITTNGPERFNDIESLLNSTAILIRITIIGQNYLNVISQNIAYLQEIMLDCRMPELWVSHEVNISDIYSKFLLLNDFLAKIKYYDEIETTKFIHEKSVEIYKEKFGTPMINTKIYRGISRNFMLVLQTIITDNPTSSPSVRALQENFEIHCRDSEVMAKKKLT